MEKRVDADVAKKRTAREDMVSLARPQEGVDALAGKFKRETKSIPGVVAKKSDRKP
jgi:hypothetical protein